MKSKYLYWIGGCLVALLLLGGAFSTGLVAGRLLAPKQSTPVPTFQHPPINQPTQVPENGNQPASPTQPISPPASVTPPNSSGDLQSMFATLTEVWDIIHAQYVDQPIDNVALMQGAVSGMMDALGDQHSSYMNPDQYQQANMPLDGTYEGIGAWVDPNGDYLTIISPMPDSPAETAGLKPGDQVIAVDGKDMTGVDGNLVIRSVLGPAGSKVTLTILREGEADPLDVEITRAKITIPSTEGHIIEGTNVAYVAFFQFGENSDQELRATIQDLLKQNPDGLILDLRNNGGGYLTTAIDVASEFISNGVVLYEEFGDGTRNTYKAKPGGVATDIPLVVLVNEGTASASEIVAGAIQDYGRGMLVGTTTYGKGSVQNWIPLSNDQGAVRVTIARWLTPKERLIHEIGLEPDVVVEITKEDITAGNDPQLDKAVELITSGQVK